MNHSKAKIDLILPFTFDKHRQLFLPQLVNTDKGISLIILKDLTLLCGKELYKFGSVCCTKTFFYKQEFVRYPMLL